MVRILLVFLIATFSFSNPLVNLYLDKGIKAVEKALIKQLESKEFWEERLEGKDVALGYYEDVDTLLMANKKAKTLQVFDASKGELQDIVTYSVIVGLSGDKQKEGDLKTPLGVYRVVQKFTPKDQFYGPMAYALSYPNILDKVQGKNGHGIWIHGSPIDGSKRDPMSKGCIVMDNETLQLFDTKINPKKARIIVAEDKMPIATKKDISIILASLHKWKNLWINNDVDGYLSFYAPNFTRYNGMKRKEFAHMKKSIFARGDKKSITIKEVNISPYPNEEGIKLYKVSFYEIYKSKRHKFRGTKQLYVTLDGDKFSILVEK